MAHYALLDKNNLVTQVITGNEEHELDVDWEEYYGDIFGQVCKRTSYNTHGNQHSKDGVPFRLNYAGIGYEYREDLDGFIPPQPHQSWALNEETGLWEAPVPHPNDNGVYVWNEDILNWVLIYMPESES